MKNAKYLTPEKDVISFQEFGRNFVVDAGNPIFEKVKSGNVIAPYVAPEIVVNLHPDLTPRRFEWLLAYTGLGDVWDALELALKDTDRAAFAKVKSERRAASYQIGVTLDLVAQFRPMAAQVAPGVDLSDDAIKAAWEMAARGNE